MSAWCTPSSTADLNAASLPRRRVSVTRGMADAPSEVVGRFEPHGRRVVAGVHQGLLEHETVELGAHVHPLRSEVDVDAGGGIERVDGRGDDVDAVGATHSF